VVCSRTNVKPSTRIRETHKCWNRHQVILSTSHGRLVHPSKYPLSALLQGCILQKRNLPSFHLENRPMSGDRSTCIYTKKATSRSKALGEIQRPTPRPSVYGVWGSRTGEDTVVDGLVESSSLGRRRSGGAKLGVGGSGGIYCGFTCLGESALVDTGRGCVRD
jgi:hypothetical protein